MFANVHITSLALIAAAIGASALPSASLGVSKRATGVVPTAPGPGESFKEGGTCTTEWSPDTSGTWKSFTISLMTGSNSNMTKLGDVVKGLDGTSTAVTSYSFPCPNVEPNSAIYFYQYTLADGTSPTWTTRWTIAGSDGSMTAPSNQKQADGSSIPWGTGKLVGSIQSSSASGSDSSASSSNSGSASASTTSVNSASTGSTVNSSTSSRPASNSASTSTSSSAPTYSNASASSSRTATSQNSTSGAAGVAVGVSSCFAALAAVAGVAVLLA